MKTIKHKGVRIVPVKVIRYEVQDPTGKKLKTATRLDTAKAWIDGFVAAADRAARSAGAK